jgi:hypothetical protein
VGGGFRRGRGVRNVDVRHLPVLVRVAMFYGHLERLVAILEAVVAHMLAIVSDYCSCWVSKEK